VKYFIPLLLIGDIETVAEKLIGEIHATHPVHMCFSFKVGATPHKAAMRSMELMMTEISPRRFAGGQAGG